MFVTLRNHHFGKQLSGTNDKRACLSNNEQNWEIWLMEKVEGHKYAFKSFHGTYLTSNNNGEAGLQPHCKAWEHFEVVPIGEGLFFIESHHGSFLRGNNDGNKVDFAKKSKKWELWEIRKTEGNREWFRL